MRAELPGPGLLIILLLTAVFPLPAETESVPRPQSTDPERSGALVEQALGIINLSGTARDWSKAVNLLEDAASLDDPRAQYYLGLNFYNGEGVVKNYRKACFWFMLAAANDHAAASLSLEQCLRKLSEDDAELLSQQVHSWRQAHETR